MVTAQALEEFTISEGGVRSNQSKFSKELINKSAKYIKSKTGRNPSIEDVNEFLDQTSQLGQLFLINLSKFKDFS